MQLGGFDLDFELLNFLWVVAVFIWNNQRQTIKEQNEKISKQSERINEMEKNAEKAVSEPQMREFFNQENGPIKQDLKELGKEINDSMRSFDSQIHLLALDIARGPKEAGRQQ